MHTLIEKECNTCGARFYARRNVLCKPYTHKCTGIMCRVVVPIAGKRLSGVLCRDKTSCPTEKEIIFITNGLLEDVFMYKDGVWDYGRIGDCHEWTTEQWKEQYGKLPRKGSKEAVILELSDEQRTSRT